MNPTVIGTIVFVFAATGAMLGLQLSTRLPEGHLKNESRDLVKLAIGLIATITALVLGLVTASAKSSFDEMTSAVKESARDVITLDRMLAQYGPETAEIRAGLQQVMTRRVDQLWPRDSSRPAQLDPFEEASKAEGLERRISSLTPRDDFQRSLQSRAQDLSATLLQRRWVASPSTSIPVAFLIVLVFWLTVTFTIFGMLGPRNGTVVAVLLICALSVATAVFIILELGGPFDGLLRVSAEPWRYALVHLNK